MLKMQTIKQEKKDRSSRNHFLINQNEKEEDKCSFSEESSFDSDHSYI